MSKKLLAVALFVSLLLAACTPKGAATFAFSNDSVSVEAGASFTVELVLNSGSQAIDAVDAVLKFDSQVLELSKIEKGTIFEVYPLLVSDNDNGEIKVSAASATDFFEGEANFATLTFKAAKSGKTKVIYAFEPASSLDTDVMSQGTDVLGAVGTLEVTVN